MVVISDTSPLTALLQAGHEELLRGLFGHVVIPPSVLRELLCAHSELPSWLGVLTPQMIPSSVARAGLGLGETEAIALAMELRPDALLMDERLGRRIAMQHGLPVTGLLGIIVLAKKRRLITEVAPVIKELQEKGHSWFGRELLITVCGTVGERWE